MVKPRVVSVQMPNLSISCLKEISPKHTNPIKNDSKSNFTRLCLEKKIRSVKLSLRFQAASGFQKRLAIYNLGFSSETYKA